MLKKFSVLIFICTLMACASEPTEKGFTGTGDFDTVEAAKTRVSLGLTYLKNGNFSQAKFNLDKALEFAPRSGEANFAMAFYYQQVGENERAEEYYQSAIAYSRNDPDVLNSYGAFLCKQGKYDKAKKYFLQAVDDKSYISTAETYENLAICTQSEGLTDEAISYFNSALNHQPTRASTLLYLAQLYAEKQQWEDAKRSLWKYERNASVNDESLWLSYQIAKGQNDFRAALEYAELLKRLYPNSVNAQKALNQLGKFQPGMTVTQKGRQSIAKTAETSISEASINDQTQATADIQTKNTRVIVPVNNSQIAEDSEDDQVLVDTTPQIDETQESQDTLVQQDNQLPIVEQTELSNSEPIEAASVLNEEQNAEADTGIRNLKTEMSEAQDMEALLAETLNANVIPEPLLTQAEDAQANDEEEIDNQQDAASFHVVQPKENLYRISLKYNVKVKKLLEWNNLEDASNIQTGTRLWVRDPNKNE